MLDFINGRFSIGARAAIICILSSLPAFVAAALFIIQSWKDISFAHNEMAGVALTQRIWPGLEEGGGAIGGAIERQASAFNAGEAAKAFAQAADPAERMSAGASLIVAVANGSQLSADPDLNTYYVQDAVTVRLPVLLMAADALERAGNAAGAREPRRLTIALNQVSVAADAASASLSAAIRGSTPSPTRIALSPHLAAMKAAIERVLSRQDAEGGHLDAAQAARMAASLRMQIDATWRASASELLRLLTARNTMLIVRLTAGIGLCAASLLLAFVVAAVLVKGLLRRLSTLLATMDTLATNDTAVQIPLTSDTNETGRIAAGLIVFRDNLIERQKLQEDATRQSRRFEAALDNMVQGLCLFDAQHRLAVYNSRFAIMFGQPVLGAGAADLLPGQKLSGMFLPPDAMQRNEDTHEIVGGRVIQVSRQAIAGEGWVATYEDVTERRQSQDRLSYMAQHDALTGLPNRVHFREHVERLMPHIRRGATAAVLYLDLDGFKMINDSLGHPIGDALLTQVARRLLDNCRETDVVARLGGDEFAIVQAGAEQPRDATALATRLVEAMRAPFDLEGHSVEIGTSIGIVLTEKTSSTPDELLRNADIALYRAKAGGRGMWCFFAPEMDVAIQQRRRLGS